MHRPHEPIVTGCQLVKLWIFEVEITLTHRTFHIGDGVAHHATEPSLRLGPMDDLFEGVSHKAAIQHGRIGASATPLRGLGAYTVLHVLNALAIPLIVERRKMVRRALPLFVDIGMTALAAVGLHEKLA